MSWEGLSDNTVHVQKSKLIPPSLDSVLKKYRVNLYKDLYKDCLSTLIC